MKDFYRQKLDGARKVLAEEKKGLSQTSLLPLDGRAAGDLLSRLPP